MLWRSAEARQDLEPKIVPEQLYSDIWSAGNAAWPQCAEYLLLNNVKIVKVLRRVYTKAY